jgi:DNA polymerase III alpha subunit (gram-positive type)
MQLLDFVAQHCPSEDAAPVLIAHNGKRFDVPFLAMEFKRVGLVMPTNWYFLDTLYLARNLISKDDLPSHDQVFNI